MTRKPSCLISCRSDACSWHVQPRPPDMVGEGLQVLHDGGEVELIASAGKAPQPHTLETVVRLQVRKAHLYLLALVTGFGELRCTHQGARCIPCVLSNLPFRPIILHPKAIVDRLDRALHRPRAGPLQGVLAGLRASCIAARTACVVLALP